LQRTVGPWARNGRFVGNRYKEFTRQIAASGNQRSAVDRRTHCLRTGNALISPGVYVQYRALTYGLHKREGYSGTRRRYETISTSGLVHLQCRHRKSGRVLKLDLAGIDNIADSTLGAPGQSPTISARNAKRHRGGIFLVGAMGAEAGVPYMAND